MIDRISEIVQQKVRELRARRCAVPFIIWFRERSGSTHLCEILNHHRQVRCRRELFDVCRVTERNQIDDDVQLFEFGGIQYFRTIYRIKQENGVPVCDPVVDPTSTQIEQLVQNLYSDRLKACGFKIKFPVQVDSYPEVINEIGRLYKTLHVIALDRRNTLKQAVSRMNMLRIQSVFQANNLEQKHEVGEQFMQPFELDVAETVDHTRYLMREQSNFLAGVDRLKERIDNLKVLHVNYEDLLCDNRETVQKIYRFLNVDPNARIRSRICKATPDNLAEAVKNYDELVEAVSGTEMEWMV